jgi:NAD(P)-dependent dehydrogenase (short-subunit alcohol dehydrogenase family)
MIVIPGGTRLCTPSPLRHNAIMETAVVIGSAGGVGAAFVSALEARNINVIGLSRHTTPPLDLLDETTIAAAAANVRAQSTDIRLILLATGFLHGNGLLPEKSLAGLNAAGLAHNFSVNAIGPALIMKHFLPLLPRAGRSVFAALSAKVGSIGDNRTGGWYAYRASKAALNQLIHTAAIELARRAPDAVCVALHPGTVDTNLSAPFAKAGLTVRPPAIAAAELLAVLDGLAPTQTGKFFDYKGAELPW